MDEVIFKRAAYKALKHEADTHELPATKEAYERAARIIDQMPAVIAPYWNSYCNTANIYVDIRDDAKAFWCGQCGETVHPEDEQCKNCGAILNEIVEV